MIKYWNIKGDLHPLEQWEAGCWMQITNPDEGEMHEVTARFNIPDDFLDDIADRDEHSRYDSEEGWTLIILRIPHSGNKDVRTPYSTIPLGIVFRDDVMMTITYFDTDMMRDFTVFHKKRGEGFVDVVDLTFRLFLSSAAWYLKHLNQIGRRIDQAKLALDREVDNASLVALSRLQDSITYFNTSIRGNENLLLKLKFKLPIDELDADLIEDVGIEMNQAREITRIYSDILESTMDTYANVINNNMNHVMRTLTSFSIIMMFPTLVASIFGMNLINGMEESHYGMAIALIISLGISMASWVFLKHKRML